MKPNNPSAFPVNMEKCYEKYQGMTLRDYFAAKAMQAMLTGIYSENETGSPGEILDRMELIHKNAYWNADAMLKQREL